jgi:ABC-type transport system substrate-binding protein
VQRLSRAIPTALILVVATLSTPVSAEGPKVGGTMVVSFNEDINTLDPAIGYDLQNWAIIRSLYDRLMDYKPGTAVLQLSLADDVKVSADWLTYTFRLRPGIKFYRGRELVADDVKYSLERTANPKTQSPGAGFYANIAGYDEVAGGKATELAGVKVIDPHGLSITLKRPDATFLHELALNFASVVAREDVEKWGEDYGKHPNGTGAFFVAEWTLGQRVVLERNGDHFVPDTPKLDRVVFELGLDPSTAFLRFRKGEVDVLGDGIPPGNFSEVMDDPALAKLVAHGPGLQVSYLTMNVEMPPFTDVRVRQAVNMAIDKTRIAKITNGRGTPTNQILPPLMPGYDKSEKGHPYDPARAKVLLGEAGLGQGFETELYVFNKDPNPRIAQAIQQDLAEVGIKVAIRSQAQANVIEAGGSPKTAPMVWSGGMGWTADFPDPSNFYGPILGCGSAVQGGWNWSWYCNKAIDADAAKANAIVDPNRQEERIALWRSIYGRIMQEAPWVPIMNQETYILHSARISGDPSLFTDPVHGPVNYDHVYATE